MGVSERILPTDKLPHVAGDGQLITVQELDLLTEKVTPPVPLLHLSPLLTAHVPDQVDRLTLRLGAPNLSQEV